MYLDIDNYINQIIKTHKLRLLITRYLVTCTMIGFMSTKYTLNT